MCDSLENFIKHFIKSILDISLDSITAEIYSRFVVDSSYGYFGFQQHRGILIHPHYFCSLV